MHLARDDLAFLARFATTPDGVLLLGFLKEKLQAVESLLRKADGNDLYRCQGRALELDELIADISGAATKIVRARSLAMPRSIAGLATPNAAP